MRSFLGGLLGLCLGLALLPDVASARTDARTSAQGATSSRAVAASRPTTSSTATRRAAATTSRQASATTARTSAARSSTVSRSAARSSTMGRTAARSGGSRQAAAIPYARQATAQPSRSLRHAAVASCTTRNGRRVCSPSTTRTAAFRWTGGLAPAAMSQAGCPDGTIATMALGHNDITRCVPL